MSPPVSSEEEKKSTTTLAWHLDDLHGSGHDLREALQGRFLHAAVVCVVMDVCMEG